MQNKTTVVFIGGFLMPDNWTFHKECEDIRVINVFPSPVGSLHDRAIEIFYELKGGRGAAHSQFHGHDKNGVTFHTGKYEEWSADCPVYIVGHSYGGLTARVLHQYLAESKFDDYNTDSSWVAGIVAVNSPLNGAMMTYVLGEHMCHPPVVHWGSVGFWLSNIIHALSYLDLTITKSFMNPKLGQWRLKFDKKNSYGKLFLSLAGVTMGSNTDNAAYDLSLHSQSVWAESLQDFPDSYYLSIVGSLSPKTHSNKLFHRLWLAFDVAQKALLHGLFANISGCCVDSFSLQQDCAVAGIDCKPWLASGWDGFVTVSTQTKPFLSSIGCKHDTQKSTFGSVLSCHDYNHTDALPLPPQSHSHPPGRQVVRPGVWYTTTLPIEHMRLVTACAATWECVWQAVRIFETSRRQCETHTTQGTSIASSSTPAARSNQHNRRLSMTQPDMQPYDAYLSVHNGNKRCVRESPRRLDLIATYCVLIVAGAYAVRSACVNDTLNMWTQDKHSLICQGSIGFIVMVVLGLVFLMTFSVACSLRRMHLLWSGFFSVARVLVACTIICRGFGVDQNRIENESGWVDSELLLLFVSVVHVMEMLLLPITHNCSSSGSSLTLHTLHTLLLIFASASCCRASEDVPHEHTITIINAIGKHNVESQDVILVMGVWCLTRELMLLLRLLSRVALTPQESTQTRLREKYLWCMVIWPVHIGLAALLISCTVVVWKRLPVDDEETSLLQWARLQVASTISAASIDIYFRTVEVSESFQIFWLRTIASSQSRKYFVNN